ncbi:DUF2303 family protein [Alcaligenaceae bacterium]|nr:DUF2303 family protein [Alcaligenaceae bacterium]
MDLVDKNAVDTILDAAGQPFSFPIGADNGQLIAVPEGWSLETDARLEQLQNAPYRKKGHSAFKAPDSFVAYVNKHKQTESLLYAQVNAQNNAAPLTIRAVFNDHQGAGLNDTNAGWCDFTASLAPQASHEWKTWTELNSKPMSQFEFALFIEDNIKDVATEEGYPSGTEMLKMALQFELSQDKRIKSAIRIQSGGTNIEYVDNDDAATVERMQAFDKFMLGIPVFWQGQAYFLEAKLRYRVREGVLKLWYDLVRSDLVVDDAVKQILADVQQKTDVTVLYGEIVK